MSPRNDGAPERCANSSIHRDDLPVDDLEIDATALQGFELDLELTIQVTFADLRSHRRDEAGMTINEGTAVCCGNGMTVPDCTAPKVTRESG
nr:hypothetical protein [Bradyrhizobium sp. URHD0069]